MNVERLRNLIDIIGTIHAPKWDCSLLVIGFLPMIEVHEDLMEDGFPYWDGVCNYYDIYECELLKLMKAFDKSPDDAIAYIRTLISRNHETGG
jgi:hypothetical protein